MDKDGGQGDSIVLEEEIDPNYEPTEKEVIEYATWLGMDLEAEKDLFWIAREGLKAPLPENWKPCKTTDTEEIYYFNFATGQSTWDHPCDEFYRNLYEEHKKKKHGGAAQQEVDEKRRKEKEDVAELLGRGKGKKKKGAKADTLAPAGPTLSKTGSLEMKPLSKLGALGPVMGGGPGPGALKPAGSLGRLKAGGGGAKGTAHDDDDDGEDEALQVPKALSKPPLGGLLTKKPLPTSASISNAPLGRVSESKADLEELNSEFENKKEALQEQHRNAIHELESQQEQEISVLKHRLQKQLDETREEEEASLKQMKREFERKKNDIENQFDRDESALLRQRKEKLKKLESDMETALSQKKQDLDKDFRTESDKLQARHDAKLREMKDEFASDERKLSEKLEAALGEKTESTLAVSRLKAEVDRLTSAQATLEQQVRDSRTEIERLTTEKRSIDEKWSQSEKTVVELRQELETVTKSICESKGGESSDEAECSRCEEVQAKAKKWEKEAEAAQCEASRCREELEKLRNELADAINDSKTRESDQHNEHLNSIAQREQEISTLNAVERELRSEVDKLRQREAELGAQMKQLEVELETSNSKRNTDTSVNVIHNSSSQDEELRGQLSDALNQVNALKSERSDLQDQIGVLETTNTQIKDQLLKESNEKKQLRERLDRMEAELRDAKASAADSSQLQILNQQSEMEMQLRQLRIQLEDQSADHQLHSTELQRQLEASITRDKEQQTTCESLRSQIVDLETEKRSSLADIERLSNEKRKIEAEKTAISTQLQAARDASATRQTESTNSAVEDARALLDDKTREFDALQVSFKGACAEREHFANRVEELGSEIDTLHAQMQRLELAFDNEKSRGSRLETEKTALVQRLKEVEENLEAQMQKTRTQTNESAGLKAQLGKSKLKEQGTADRLAQITEEKNELESALQNRQHEIDAVSKELRSKTGEIEEKQSQIRELQAENDVLQDQISDLKASVSELRARLQTSTASIGTIVGGGGNARNESTLLRDQLSECEGKLDAIVRDKAQLTEKVRALTQKCIDSESQTRNISIEKEQLAAELEVSSTEVAKWRMKAERATKDIEAKAASIQELESDKELLESSIRRLTEQANEISQSKSVAEKSKKALESEVNSLRTAMNEAEASRRASTADFQSLQSKAKRLEDTVASSNHQIQVLQEAKAGLEATIAQQAHELASLQTKIRSLMSENAEVLAGAKETEADLSRNSDAFKQLEEQLSSIQLQYNREREEREGLAKQVESLKAAREELENTVTSLRRKSETANSKWKEYETNTSRDDQITKRKLQQAEIDKDSLSRAKDRAEAQLKAVEKELNSRTEALERTTVELEALQTRMKNMLKEHEEVRAMLLSANLANASGANSRRNDSTSFPGSNIPSEAMLVKLQLADVNRSELEVHLADVASQLEIANRRCALLDARCRDQSIDIESLHVEIASLRSASQQMHLSALETLSLVERLEYEHKKRVLKTDFTNQLRDFQEREDASLARQKARIRSQCERQIDELVAEMEKRKRHRVEQEEAAAQHLLDHLRRERDARREELQVQIRKELHDFEQDLLERKNRELDVISKAVEKEEAHLAQRLREAHQAVREEELARQAEDNQGREAGFLGTGVPLSTFVQHPVGGTLAGVQDKILLSDEEVGEVRRSHSRRARLAANRRVSQSQRTDRVRKARDRQVSKAYSHWKSRVQNEQALLSQAKALVSRQRQELLATARQLKKSTSEWKKNSHNARDNQIRLQMKEMIDEDSANWSERKSKLAERENWIKKRERKLARMELEVEQLRQGQKQRRRKKPKSNNDDLLFSDAESDSSSSSGHEAISEASEMDVVNALERLKKLDHELLSDSNDWAEKGAAAGSCSSAWESDVSDVTGVRREALHPTVYSPRYQLTASGTAGSYRHAVSSFSTGIGLRPKTTPTTLHRISPTVSSRADTSRWLFGGQRSGFSGQRFSGSSSGPRMMTSNDRRLADRATVYQRQISKWAQDREKVHSAASRHASWLSGLCDEIKEYTASRRDVGVRESNSIMASTADTSE